MGRDKPGKPRKPRRTDPDADKTGGVTVQSDVDPGTGAYITTVHVGEDFSFVVKPGDAVRYASQVLAVANQADHDAAVMRQLHEKLGIELEAVTQVVMNDLRPDRPPTDHEATRPLEFYAGVSLNKRTGKLHGHVVLTQQGEQTEYGRFQVGQMRMHALSVLDVVSSSEMDFGYFKALRSLFELDEPRARNVVHDLINFRESWW